jgi:hypothetical protein
MADLVLTPEQETQAQQIAAIIGKKVHDETLQIARLLASQPDATIFGKTEFDIRDRVHDIGAHAFATALSERKKGGTTGRA